MGLPKKEHIRAIATAHGRSDIDALYAAFIPKQMESLVEHSGVIAGVSDAVEWDALGDGARDGLLRAARDRLYAAGADYVVDSVAEVDDALDSIDERLGRGERP